MLVPREYWGDFAILAKLVPNLESWKAEIAALLSGMHGPSVTLETMGRAVRDYVASAPIKPSLRHFRSFVRGIEKEAGRAEFVAKEGNLLRAGEVINALRKFRNPQFPTNLLPGWEMDFHPPEIRAIKAVGIDRILNDKAEGVVLAQLAKMLGEAT